MVKLLKYAVFLGLFLAEIPNVGIGTVMGNQISSEDIFFLASGKLYRVTTKAETASIAQVSNDIYSVSELAVLPDGRYVYTAHLRGETPTRQTSLMFGPMWNKRSISFPKNLRKISDLSLSPDGERLLFVSSALYCQNLTTGKIEQLVPDGGVIGAPSWSPGNTRDSHLLNV